VRGAVVKVTPLGTVTVGGKVGAVGEEMVAAAVCDLERVEDEAEAEE
jgi:hypothetical protein